MAYNVFVNRLGPVRRGAGGLRQRAHRHAWRARGCSRWPGASGRGGGLRGHGELPLTADINVTSLVDVAFVLLIIFMITAPIMQGGVDVAAAPGRGPADHRRRRGWSSPWTGEGRIFIDETGVSYDDFRMTLRRAGASPQAEVRSISAPTAGALRRCGPGARGDPCVGCRRMWDWWPRRRSGRDARGRATGESAGRRRGTRRDAGGARGGDRLSLGHRRAAWTSGRRSMRWSWSRHRRPHPRQKPAPEAAPRPPAEEPPPAPTPKPSKPAPEVRQAARRRRLRSRRSRTPDRPAHHPAPGRDARARVTTR